MNKLLGDYKNIYFAEAYFKIFGCFKGVLRNLLEFRSLQILIYIFGRNWEFFSKNQAVEKVP